MPRQSPFERGLDWPWNGPCLEFWARARHAAGEACAKGGMMSPSAKKRIAIGGLLHETHGFAPTPTELADFRHTWYAGDALIAGLEDTRTCIGGMIEGIQQREDRWQLLPTFYAAAMPAGIVTAEAYEELLNQLAAGLEKALPVDGLLLHLHGAMISASAMDAETDIVQRLRQQTGPDVPILAVLDMHGNINPAMAEFADVLLAYDTTPHIDLHARGLELADLLDECLTGRLDPATVVRRPPLLLAPQLTDTQDMPLRALHARVREWEEADGVAAVSLLGGFAYADTPWTGPSVIAVTNDDLKLANEIADELCALFMEHRGAAAFRAMPPAQAVSAALNAETGPVILVDSADNIGGGTPGDGTEALAAMLAADVQEGAVVLADPEAVALCHAAGPGARLTLAMGGKTDELHGPTLEVTGRVMAVSDGDYPCELDEHHFAAFYGDTLDMGPTAWLRAGGVNIVLNTRKTPPFDLAQLRGIGVTPEDQQMIVVKAAVAYRTAYMPIAASVIEMDTAGLCTSNLERFEYTRLPRPVFPLDRM